MGFEFSCRTKFLYKGHMYEQAKAGSLFLREHPSQTAETEHFLMHYLHEGSGLPLVLIHGGGMWLYSYRHNITPLSRSFSVYAVDMPGYGFTRMKAPYLTMGTQAMTLALREFLDALKIEKASIVGHSWGGGWALAFAQEFPERVGKIVLINSSGIDQPDVFEWELLKVPVLGRLMLRFLTLGMTRSRLELSFHRQGKVDDAMAQEVLLPMKIPANQRAQASIARALCWAEVEGRLHELHHEVLLIWGEMDRYLDRSHVERFRERIADIRTEIISHCGHSAHEESPEAVNALIEGFLKA